MFFYLPPFIRWQPEQLCTDLALHQLDATVDANEVHLTLSSDSCDAWRERHTKLLTRRERTALNIGGPHVSIRYFPERFLRNLQLIRNVFKVPPTEPQLKLAEDLILKTGATSIDSADTEFAIAYGLCTDHKAIDGFRSEIEYLMREKERFIEQQDFQAAAGARDREYGVRAQLDSLLLHVK